MSNLNLPKALELRSVAAALRGRQSTELVDVLMQLAAAAQRIENGGIEISRHDANTWAFDGIGFRGKLVRGTAGSEDVVTALTNPFEPIQLVSEFEPGRGRIRRAIRAFAVAPKPVVEALKYVRTHRRGNNGFVQFEPPPRIATFTLARYELLASQPAQA